MNTSPPPSGQHRYGKENAIGDSSPIHGARPFTTEGGTLTLSAIFLIQCNNPTRWWLFMQQVTNCLRENLELSCSSHSYLDYFIIFVGA